MALTLNGTTNTIGGLAVGGLPDGIVDTDMIAASAVTAAKRGTGAILQVSHVNLTTLSSTSSTSYVDISNLTVNHTPLSSSNKLHIVAHIQNLVINSGGQEGSVGLNIMKDSTEIAGIELRSKDYGGSGMRNCTTGIIDAYITAGTTSQITFKCQMKMINGSLIEINPGNASGSDSDQSSIFIYEVAA